jgi:hypothetical protein
MVRPELEYVRMAPRLPDDTLISTFKPRSERTPIRAFVENEIEKLIAFLDMIDGDPDLEDTHDHERDSEGGSLEFGIDQSEIFIGSSPRSAKAP